MTPRAITARDAGLALVGRINRWTIAGAVALSGAISIVAARSFHGHTVSSTGSPASQPAQSSGSAGGASSSSSSGGGLQQPAQAPSSAPAPSAPAPVVSGGS